jgi:hypothetical protein
MRMPRRDDEKEGLSFGGLDPEVALRGLLAVDSAEVLPDFADVYIPDHKLRDYLLSPTHKEGRHKLRLFKAKFGIGPDDRERCAEMLIEATRGGTVENVRKRPDCRVYAIKGSMEGVDGAHHEVRICWKVPHEGGRPTFVTAYPID